MCHYQCPCGSSEVYLDPAALIIHQQRKERFVKIESGRLLRVWGGFEINVNELAVCKDCGASGPIHEFMQPTNLRKDMGKEERLRWNQLHATLNPERENHCPDPDCDGVLCLMIDGDDIWWYCNDCKKDHPYETEERKSDEPTHSTADEEAKSPSEKPRGTEVELG